MPDLTQLERDLDALEQDQSLYFDDNLAARFLALKRLDFLQEALQLRANYQPVAARLQRVRTLQANLEQRNQALFDKLRTGIGAGTAAPRNCGLYSKATAATSPAIWPVCTGVRKPRMLWPRGCSIATACRSGGTAATVR